MNREYFLLDTNAYRNLSRNLNIQGVLAKAHELAVAEKQKSMQALCSVIVAVELISHLGKNDPEKAECYNALCLLRYHTFDGATHSKRVIAYPMENVLTNFFIGKDFVLFDDFNQVIRLMELLTEDCDIENCLKYDTQIEEIKKSRLAFKQAVVDEADKMLKGQGLDWDSFTANSVRKDVNLKALNKTRTTEFNNGTNFYRLAKILIDKTFEGAGHKVYKTPNKKILQNYLNTFQAPLRLYHYLLKKIGEAPRMEDVEDTRWNTINDMHLLFSVCDPNFDNVLLVTDDSLVMDCVLTTDGLENNVGGLSQYLLLIGVAP